MEPLNQKLTDPMTADQAVANAVRLLEAAELERDLAFLERLGLLADSWIAIATLLVDR
jgi:hypothetical protein